MSVSWIITLFVQIGILFQKDAKLARRRWKSSLSRVLMPSVILFAYWMAFGTGADIVGGALGGDARFVFSGSDAIEPFKCASDFCPIIAVDGNDGDLATRMLKDISADLIHKPNTTSEISDETVLHLQAYVGVVDSFFGDDEDALLLKGSIEDPITGAVTQASDGWPWMAKLIGNGDYKVELVYTRQESVGSESSALNVDDFSENAVVPVTLLLFVAFFPFQLATHTIVTEDRRNQLDTSLRIAGAYVGAIVLSQFLIELLFSFVSALVFALLGSFVFRLPFMAWQPVFFFFVAWLMALNHAVYGFVLGRLFHRVERASALLFANFLIGIVFFLYITIPGNLQDLFQVPLNWWSILGFAQNEAAVVRELFAFVAQNATVAEITPLRTMLSVGENTMYKTQQHFNFMILDVFVFVFFAYYLSYVRPGDSGVPKGCCFCCNPFFWFDRSSSSSDTIDIDSLTTGDNEQMVMASLDEDINRECIRTNTLARSPKDTPLILLQLTKLYRAGRLLSKRDVRAVDSVTVHGEAGSVLAVLGHNGAGKTSLLKMLVGTSAPSFGDALLWGKSLASNHGDVTHCVGLCPQENITWPLLTVRENVELYSRIKRGRPSEVDEILRSVELYDRRDDYGYTLSGGMKRRLTFAMSLVANPSIVVLDEPSSGLDAQVKQVIWNVIEELRNDNRLVVLCTHDMHEAESLADKLVIMAKGRLRSVGKIAPLKERFKIGYRVQINVSHVDHVSAVQESVARIIGAEVNHTLSSRALTYRVPLSAALTIVSQLEQQAVEHVEYYEFSQGDVEDLFMRVIHGVESVEAIENDENIEFSDDTSEIESSEDKNTNNGDGSSHGGDDVLVVDEEKDDARLFEEEFVKHEKTKRKVVKLEKKVAELKAEVKELKAQLKFV